MKIPRLSPSRRVLIIALTLVCLLVWVVGRHRIKQMDERFFQWSEHGAWGLTYYLLGDSSRAAKAYRAHFGSAILEQGSLGDPMQDAIVLGARAEATSLAQAALAKDPDDIQALLTLGEVAYDTGDLEQAARHFAAVLEKHPEQVDALLLLSLAYARSGAYDAAIETFNRGLRYNAIESRLTTFLKLMEATGDLAWRRGPEKPLSLLATYYRYFRIFDHSNGNRVIAYARQAIAAGDRPADAYLTMGIIYQKEGRREEALQAFLKAIALAPTQAYAYRWAGEVYSGRGDLANEYRMRRAAFERAPADPYYAFELGDFLENRLGDYHQAMVVARKLLEAAPTNIRALAWAGSLHTSMGEYARSVECYRQAMALAPRDPYLYDGIGYPLMELGKLDEAMEAYRTAVAIRPDLSHAHILLASLYQTQRRVPEAIEEYETAFRYQRPAPSELAQLCVMYHWSSKYAIAETCFRQVLAEDPRNKVASHLLPYTLQNLQKQGKQ